MLKNYLLISFRKFQRQKFYSVINIFGLAAGLTSVMLITLYVLDEVSYDQFYSNADRIYRVVENQYYPDQPVFPVAVTPGPLAPSLKRDYPEVEESARYTSITRLFVQGEKKIIENGAFIDPDFFRVFSLDVLSGDVKGFKGPGRLIINESLAKKYFFHEAATGKTITLNKTVYEVVAVMKDFPPNSHIRPDFFISMEALIAISPETETNWDSNSYYTYVKIRKDALINELNKKVLKQIKKYKETSLVDIYLQPLTDIHLGTVSFTADVGGKGDIRYVQIFAVVAVFILFIACINFMNLATARSMKRSKEVGLRKTVGAHRWQLIIQFLSESVAVVLVSLSISILLTDLLLPSFNTLTGKHLDLSFLKTGGQGIPLMAGLIGVALLTGILAGSYPAIFLSSFQPASVLKGKLAVASSGGLLRKVLVVFQFSIAMIMITGTILVHWQMQYIQNVNLGYNKENMITIPLISNDYASFKKELLRYNGVIDMTVMNQHPLFVGNSSNGFEWEGMNPTGKDILFHLMGVGTDYTKTMKSAIVQGRDFSENTLADTTSVLLNEEAVKVMNLKDPIGSKLITIGNKFEIVGVVKNFNFKTVHQKIEPLIIFMDNKFPYGGYMMIRIKPDATKEMLSVIEGTWKQFNPGQDFEYEFLDKEYENAYRAEQRTSVIFSYFSSLAIIISCLGLFGLASFTIEQKAKEFGIRKVFGASFMILFSGASWNFIVLVLIAFLISIPVSWYFMSSWLNGFAYRITLSASVFFLSGLIAIVIALITVSYQSFKAATQNPTDSLRSE